MFKEYCIVWVALNLGTLVCFFLVAFAFKGEVFPLNYYLRVLAGSAVFWFVLIIFFIMDTAGDSDGYFD